ncbi:acyltransferase family protein [Thalassospira povalilytica]|uniref:Acyltransferase n=1 Tax=Thalassospira povalilytica TaxID=732237 RepID=A0ABX4R9X7_9PROT|nr:acyltransferase family protein [Thalassospira povalilytica]PKR50836.1 hypothetical protein CU041_04500 [Thalassospira povalilytica]
MSAYYKSIDGLRAIAVVGVILYHCGLATFSGGYTGVDVFFVISGYLIVSGIARDIDANSFSLKSYLVRRVRRIVPVLIGMLFVVSFASVFILLPEDLDFYGLSLLGASAFIPNVIFNKAFSYFTSSNSPVIHLWSIGVEVQFYVGISLFLVCLSKMKLLNRTLFLVVLLSLISFVSNIVLIENHQNPVFYYTPFRFWEFGLGAIVGLGMLPALRHKILENVLSFLGVILVLAPIFIYDTTWLFPGFAALAPCLGTAIILYCIESDAVLVRALRQPVLTLVGKASYSIYIWHWPIIFFYEYSLDRAMAANDIAILLVAIFAVGFASWYVIENPFYQQKNRPNSKPLIFGCLGSFAVLLLFGGGLVHFKGFPERLPPAALAVIDEAEYVEPSGCPENAPDIRERSRTDSYCVIGDQNASPSWALWGDSHARALSGPFSEMLLQNKESALLLGLHGCPALLDINVTHYLSGLCQTHNQNAYQRLLAQPGIRNVIMSSRYSLYLYDTATGGLAGQRKTINLMDGEGSRLTEQERITLFRKAYQETMQKVVSLGKNIYVMTPMPEAEFNIPEVLSRTFWRGGRDSDIKIPETDYLRLNEVVLEAMDAVAKKYPGKIHWISPHDAFCKDGACDVMADGHILYRDSNHPSSFAAHILLAPIARELQSPN